MRPALGSRITRYAHPSVRPSIHLRARRWLENEKPYNVKTQRRSHPGQE